jgi:hypothetical protein
VTRVRKPAERPVSPALGVECVFMLTQDVSEELPKGFLVADDPVLQYLRENKGKEGEDLCLLDNGSQIVSMAKEIAVALGLTWNPKIRINMESASEHVDRTLGLARNVVFRMGHLDIVLQVYILEDPPYRILLGRLFDMFTSSKIDNSNDGHTVVILTDPNTKETCVISTYKRSKTPDVHRDTTLYQTVRF